MPVRIGLTGGIASGKSLVAEMFAESGAVIIDTDVIAREVVAPGQPALEDIAAEFGESLVGGDGELDRAALSDIIFADDEARKRLEAILHPKIGEETRRQSRAAEIRQDRTAEPTHRLTNHPPATYQLIVVPLLVNSALRDFVDRILVVDCDEDTQIRRLTARDGESDNRARRMLAAQASRTERLAIADDVIRNDGTVADLRQQVVALHEIYRSLA
jgi:dephospho-CoA kinase